MTTEPFTLINSELKSYDLYEADAGNNVSESLITTNKVITVKDLEQWTYHEEDEHGTATGELDYNKAESTYLMKATWNHNQTKHIVEMHANDTLTDSSKLNSYDFSGYGLTDIAKISIDKLNGNRYLASSRTTGLWLITVHKGNVRPFIVEHVICSMPCSYAFADTYTTDTNYGYYLTADNECFDEYTYDFANSTFTCYKYLTGENSTTAYLKRTITFDSSTPELTTNTMEFYIGTTQQVAIPMCKLAADRSHNTSFASGYKEINYISTGTDKSKLLKIKIGNVTSFSNPPTTPTSAYYNYEVSFSLNSGSTWTTNSYRPIGVNAHNQSTTTSSGCHYTSDIRFTGSQHGGVYYTTGNTLYTEANTNGYNTWHTGEDWKNKRDITANYYMAEFPSVSIGDVGTNLNGSDTSIMFYFGTDNFNGYLFSWDLTYQSTITNGSEYSKISLGSDCESLGMGRNTFNVNFFYGTNKTPDIYSDDIWILSTTAGIVSFYTSNYTKVKSTVLVSDYWYCRLGASTSDPVYEYATDSKNNSARGIYKLLSGWQSSGWTGNITNCPIHDINGTQYTGNSIPYFKKVFENNGYVIFAVDMNGGIYASVDSTSFYCIHDETGNYTVLDCFFSISPVGSGDIIVICKDNDTGYITCLRCYNALGLDRSGVTIQDLTARLTPSIQAFFVGTVNQNTNNFTACQGMYTTGPNPSEAQNTIMVSDNGNNLSLWVPVSEPQTTTGSELSLAINGRIIGPTITDIRNKIALINEAFA